MSTVPPLVDATVVQQDPDNYRVYVTVDWAGGQVPMLPVDVLTHGPRDAVRGHWPELPTVGTRGLVAFTRGDFRTGRWIGATTPSLPDSSPHGVPGLGGGVDYRAHWSGGWDWEGPDGTTARVWPDGSSLLVGAVMPVPTRHVVTPDGSRVRQPFTSPQRLPTAPTPFPTAFTLASGVRVITTAAGAVTVQAAAGQPFTVEVTGGAALTLNADGSATLSFGGSPIFTVQGSIHATGAVIAGFGGGDQVGLQTHSHSQGADSHGDTEANTSSPLAGT